MVSAEEMVIVTRCRFTHDPDARQRWAEGAGSCQPFNRERSILLDWYSVHVQSVGHSVRCTASCTSHGACQSALLCPYSWHCARAPFDSNISSLSFVSMLDMYLTIFCFPSFHYLITRRCRFAHDPDARQRWAEGAGRGGGGRSGRGQGRGYGRGRGGYGSGGGRTGAGGYDFAAEFIIGRVCEWGGKLPHNVSIPLHLHL